MSDHAVTSDRGLWARAGDLRRDRSAWWFAPALGLLLATQWPLLTAAAGSFRLTGGLTAGLALLAAAAAWAAIRARRSGVTASYATSRTWTLWAVALAATIAAVAFRSPAAGAAAFLVTLLLGVEVATGARERDAVLPAWLGLWFAAPLPEQRPVDLLAAGATHAASASLDLLGVRHRVVGSFIETPDTVLPFSADPDVLFTAVGATVLLAAVLGRGPVWSGALMLAAAFWSGVLALVAVAPPVWLAVRGDGPGPWVRLLSWPTPLTVGGTLLLTLSTDRGLWWLMPHGGPATRRMIDALLKGDTRETSSESSVDPPVATGRQAGIVTALCVAVAAVWLLPPVGAFDGQSETSRHRAAE